MIDVVGKNVVLTGTFKEMKRADAAAALKALGAIVTGGLSGKTEFLFAGEKAGSKLKKAQGFGIPIYDEAALMTLLSRDATAKITTELAETNVSTATTDDAMKKVVADLRTFVRNLKKRPDVRVSVGKLGRKAGKDTVSSAQYQNQALGDFYAQMNGIHVEWEFIEPPGGGCIRIPAYSVWTKFTDDDEHYMGFGDAFEAMLLDEITAEGSTWFARMKGKKEARIVFASVAEGADGVDLGTSLVDYLRSAMKSGFAHYWPCCFDGDPHVSYAEEEKAVTRFQAKPIKPDPIRKGVRVAFNYFPEGGRGTVLQTLVAPESDTTEYCGVKIVEVELDEGSIAWIPQKWMKAYKGTDLYEQQRDPKFDFAGSDALKRFEQVTRAIGLLTSHTAVSGGPDRPSNARRAAGLLGARDFTSATRAVLDLHDQALSAKLNFTVSVRIEKSDDGFINNNAFTVGETLSGLFYGLSLLARLECAKRGVAGSELLDADLVQRVEAIESANALTGVLKDTSVLIPHCWAYSDHADAIADLGLPKDALLLY